MGGYERTREHVWTVTERVDGAIVGQYVPVAAPVEYRVQESKQRGYTGDCCDRCGMFTLRRSGTCNVCDSCGTTSSCS